jgi:hypothetical protein
MQEKKAERCSRYKTKTYNTNRRTCFYLLRFWFSKYRLDEEWTPLYLVLFMVCSVYSFNTNELAY